MEALTDNPIGVAVVLLVLVLLAGRLVVRWRRGAALRGHAREAGWRPLEDEDGFARRVIERLPELREQAEQDARAARRSGGRGGGAGLTVRLGASPRGGSRVSGRNVHAVPVEGGEVAVGDVAVVGRVGGLSQGRASLHRGAAVARVDAELPPLRLIGRDWIDRDGGDGLPEELAREFVARALDPAARETYVESGAWRALVDAGVDLDGVAAEGDTVVAVSRRTLAPGQAESVARLVGAFARGVAAGPGGAGETADRVRLEAPLARG